MGGEMSNMDKYKIFFVENMNIPMHSPGDITERTAMSKQAVSHTL